MHNKLFMVILALFAVMLGGCASVPTVTDQAVVNEAKSFSSPAKGKAHVYVFRDGWFGRRINMDLFLDGQPLGESENKHFYLIKVDAGETVHLETDSEFGNNKLNIKAEDGKVYYVRHYIRLGILFTQADFEMMTESEDIQKAQESISDSDMAVPNI
ncbi:DUF2846 domain-containing protein [Aeromonas diversa]|uniref:DUF2846 domain-containing protein n=1 Tax=Aeromonas diversa TaxID=502790 RepID=UPI00346283CA